MKIIEGDLLDPSHGFQAIGHGVNLRGVMGAGIAKSIADKWPAILPPYRNAIKNGGLRLGGFHRFRPREYWTTGDPYVFNLATQVDPGPNADLTAVWESVSRALLECHRLSIPELGLPQIGCGIGGLKWYEVHYVLHSLDAASPVKITVVKYKP